jgi:hypothetical protein
LRSHHEEMFAQTGMRRGVYLTVWLALT